MDGAFLSANPSSTMVTMLSAAILVAILWLSIVRLRSDGEPHDSLCASREMAKSSVVATVEFLVFALLRGFPLLDTLFCIGAAIVTVLWLTVGLAHMVVILYDPRKLRRFFSQPW